MDGLGGGGLGVGESGGPRRSAWRSGLCRVGVLVRARLGVGRCRGMTLWWWRVVAGSSGAT